MLGSPWALARTRRSRGPRGAKALTGWRVLPRARVLGALASGLALALVWAGALAGQEPDGEACCSGAPPGLVGLPHGATGAEEGAADSDSPGFVGAWSAAGLRSPYGRGFLTAPTAAGVRSPYGRGFLLGFRGWGLGFGHVERVRGIRMNWSERGFDRVDGVNLTLSRPAPGAAPDGRVRGLTAGLWPQGEAHTGFGLGIIGSRTVERMAGIHGGGVALMSEGSLVGVGLAGVGVVGRRHISGAWVGGLGVVAQGSVRGVQASGVGVVAEGDMSGVQAGGLAVVGEGSVRGVQVGGLGVVASDRMSGVQAGGLAVVGDQDIAGVQAAPLAVLSEEAVRGVQVGGLAVVAGGSMDGIQVGGLGVQAAGPIRGIQGALYRVENQDRITGITGVGYQIRTAEVRGLAAGGWVDVGEALGISVGAYNRTHIRKRGLSVGIYNSAEDLQGVQLGILNRAGDNPRFLRYLPFMNVGF